MSFYSDVWTKNVENTMGVFLPSSPKKSESCTEKSHSSFCNKKIMKNRNQHFYKFLMKISENKTHSWARHFPGLKVID